MIPFSLVMLFCFISARCIIILSTIKGPKEVIRNDNNTHSGRIILVDPWISISWSSSFRPASTLFGTAALSMAHSPLGITK